MLSCYLSRKLFFVFTLLIGFVSFSQTAIWIEDFDDGGGGRWTLENAPGSLDNPTPLGIVGLTYGVNAVVEHDNFIINDRNTPELNGNIAIGTIISSQGQLVQGRHYDCTSPNDLPNPFINAAAPGPNQSLHITAFPTCVTWLYSGTPQSDDWNCISDPDNSDPQTQTDQIAYLNNNIDASSSCNLVLTADFFLGGDSDGIKSHGTILYSVDAGVTWEVLEDNLRSCDPFLAGTCNNWHRRSFPFPANANNQNDIRIAFRWYDDGDYDDTGDYALGASFNVDNVVITGCDAPVADFTIDHFSGCKDETFKLTDLSAVSDGFYMNCATIISGLCDISSWTWSVSPATFNYVNGTNANSQNPEIEFTANGTYSITLTASSCGGNGVLTETNLVTIADCPPTANFTSSQLSACAIPSSSQDTVSFTDLSSTPSTPITTWNWVFTPATVTFVNGTNAGTQNVDVVFDGVGTYQVALTVTNSEGNSTETKATYMEAIDCNCGGGGGGSVTTIYTEDFDGNGGAGSNWVTAPLNQSIGAEGAYANLFYISDAEDGNAAGACGSAGSGDQSLHVSANAAVGGDLGAAYNAGGLCGFGICSDTHKRSFSNNINSTGATGLNLNFNYIEQGEGVNDDAIIEYSIDGGGTWQDLINCPKTALGACSPQGLWNAYSFALPASCEGITNLKIGFRWINNDDGIGTDPSFAIDDITITGLTGGGASANTWEGDISNAWNLAGNWSTNAVPTSADAALVPATVCGTCVMPVISAAAVAKDVCNFGVITLVTDNNLTIDGYLLNEGEVTTTTVNAAGDVVFANTPSVYKGSGTLYDVDISVTSSDLTLETNMAPRSMSSSTAGLFDIVTYTLALNRDFTKTNGTFTAINGEVHFLDACGACLDQTNISDVSINANQVFGNVLVNKSLGVKTSLVSAFNYTLNTPKTLTVQNGVLDANTFTLNGTGNVTMTGGELQLGKCATVVPEITGTYTLPAGKITFDGVCGQLVKQTSVLGTDYYKVEFNGSGIKSLTGNTNIADSLIFNLPTALGNYVNAGTDTLFVLNNSQAIVSHTGGHVLGHYNRAITASGGDYIYHVGSDNSDGETYFEPIICTPNGLINPNSVTARFLDLTPNPAAVVPNLYFGLPPTQDTIASVETEGYWHMSVKNPVIGGNYTATVSPDITYWTMANVWGDGSHTLLKQSIVGDAWDYTNGGIRVNDSTTQTFTDFSNYVLAYANNPLPNPLPIELVNFKGFCKEGASYLSWATASEVNTQIFIIERSYNGYDYELIGQIEAAGYSQQLIQYNFADYNREQDGAYYRLSEVDLDGKEFLNKVIYVDCSEFDNEFNVELFPNPSNGIFNINVYSTQHGFATVNVRNMTGQVIELIENIEINKGANLKSIYLNYPAGIYLISIEFNDEVITRKISIIK